MVHHQSSGHLNVEHFLHFLNIPNSVFIALLKIIRQKMDYSSFNEQLLETFWNFMLSGTSGHREKYALSTKPLIILSIERGANILLAIHKALSSKSVGFYPWANPWKTINCPNPVVYTKSYNNNSTMHPSLLQNKNLSRVVFLGAAVELFSPSFIFPCFPVLASPHQVTWRQYLCWRRPLASPIDPFPFFGKEQRTLAGCVWTCWLIRTDPRGGFNSIN